MIDNNETNNKSVLSGFLCRFRAAYKAFNKPHLADGYLIPPDQLHKIARGPDIAVVTAEWIGDRLVEKVFMIPPKESYEIRNYVSLY